MKIYKIQEKTFVNTLYLVVNCSKEELQKWSKTKIDHAPEISEGSDGAFYSQNGSDVVWLEKYKNTPFYNGLLGHELIHLVRAELAYKQILLTEDTDEVYAYLFQFYLTECLKALNNKK